MKDYAAEPRRIPVERRPGEGEPLTQEGDRHSEGRLDFDLQCGDSLSIAVNRISSKGMFGAK